MSARERVSVCGANAARIRIDGLELDAVDVSVEKVRPARRSETRFGEYSASVELALLPGAAETFVAYFDELGTRLTARVERNARKRARRARRDARRLRRAARRSARDAKHELES